MSWTEDADIRNILAETVHTAFRKGCDGGGSHKVWMAIHKMDRKQWTNAINWMLYALDVSGYEIREKVVGGLRVQRVQDKKEDM